MSVTFFPSGFGSDESAPFLNVANGNAGVVMSLMGRDPDDAWETNRIAYEYVSLALACVHLGTRDLTRPTVEQGNTTFLGVDQERIDYYKAELGKVLSFCILHNVDLVWG